MLNTNFSPWPSFTQQEADAVSEVLLSNKVNYWTGTKCREFENEFANWVNCSYAVTVSNGTTALDLALNALEIGHGDEVITTPRTFLATVSSIVNAGARPVFADVDLNSQNITAKSIEEVLSPKTKAIIVVHLAGMPAEMDEIMALAQKYQLKVIEDCAQAHGAMYKGQSVGTIGDIGAWSFCQDKIMTTGGEGGMVTTNNKALWERMWSYKDHGKNYQSVYEKQHPPGFRWLHDNFGTNWRMTEMQGVIGLIQLGKMKEWQSQRKRNAERINAAVSDFPSVRLIKVPEYITHAHYKHYMFVDESMLKPEWNRDLIVSKINEFGVPCYQGTCSEVYLEKAFDDTGFRPDMPLRNAELLGNTSIMFLVHPTLTEVEMDKTCEVVRSVLNKATISG